MNPNPPMGTSAMKIDRSKAVQAPNTHTIRCAWDGCEAEKHDVPSGMVPAGWSEKVIDGERFLFCPRQRIETVVVERGVEEALEEDARFERRRRRGAGRADQPQ